MYPYGDSFYYGIDLFLAAVFVSLCLYCHRAARPLLDKTLLETYKSTSWACGTFCRILTPRTELLFAWELPLCWFQMVLVELPCFVQCEDFTISMLWKLTLLKYCSCTCTLAGNEWRKYNIPMWGGKSFRTVECFPMLILNSSCLRLLRSRESLRVEILEEMQTTWIKQS